LDFASKAIAEAISSDVGHRVPNQSYGLPGVMHRQDVRVVEPRGEAYLAKKAVGT
jgi:hypothetical protein